MRKISSLLGLLSLTAGLLPLLSCPARAQLSFTLDPPSLAGTPGALLSFSGTLLNTGSAELFLSGDRFTLAGAGLTLDDTLFLENAPPSLLAGEGFAGPLFSVFIGEASPPGEYQGSFTILGGLSEGDQDELAPQSFTVRVVPEPGTGALVAAGLLPLVGMSAVVRRRRCRCG